MQVILHLSLSSSRLIVRMRIERPIPKMSLGFAMATLRAQISRNQHTATRR